MADIPGYPARRAALQMLDAVLRRGETLDQAQNGALRPLREGADRALAVALASEALRWLTDFDALIDSATARALPGDAKARSVLRLMLAGWLRLGTPPHAVIATGLPLLSGGPRRLAHGVFSTLSKREAALPAYPTLPEDVAARWGDMAPNIASGNAAGIASGLADPPPLDLMLKDASRTQEAAAAMGGISLASGNIRLPRGSKVDELPGFDAGDWWVQDLAATLPARLLGPGRLDGDNSDGRHALDLCAAPGGKTMQLAAAGWKVTAVDMSRRRLDLLKENLKRTGLHASPLRADILKWEPKHRFDAILLDAPCSASGTCRRHPDVLHRITGRQIAEMVELQTALLERAADWLNPGGVLVYAVCSLESEEGEAQAETVALTPMPIEADELPAGLQPTPSGWLRTHPGLIPEECGMDGFFIARWKK